jgi:hypothetical protein
MIRNTSGILTIAVLLSFFAPGLRSGQDALGPTVKAEAKNDKTVAVDSDALTKEENCKTKSKSFEADILRLVKRSLSTGLELDTAKKAKCPLDQFKIPGVSPETVHVIIALAPDPVHTNLPLFFDRQMDAVEQAAQDCGWIFDEALMPWDNRNHIEATDFRTRIAQKDRDAERENQPGILVFRRRFLNDHTPDRSTTNDPSVLHSLDPCGIMHEPVAASTSKEPLHEVNKVPSKTLVPKLQNKVLTITKALPAPGHLGEHLHAHHGDVGTLHKLLILVVGETPTSGIRKTQFRNAVSLINRIFGSKPPNVFRILGPTFSGSMQSLAELLTCSKSSIAYPCTKVSNVTINSGTVTGRDSVTTFNAIFKSDEAPSSIPHPAIGTEKVKRQINFHTLQEYDENAEALFLEFACERDYQSEKIAVLSEDETAYGNSLPSQPLNKPADCTQPDSLEPAILHVYFPREISQLRSAYQKALASDTSHQDRVPRSTLPLDLESASSDDDTVAQYAGKQLPLSQEAVLLGIVTELKKHSTELVLLRATNPLDQLFLARYLRQAYPQGRVIIGGADLLFSREIQDARLHGVMALTTYMLSPGEEHLFHRKNDHNVRKHSDRVFSGSDAVGTYNAMTLLLVDPPLMPGNKDMMEAAEKDRAALREQFHCPKESFIAHLAQYDWPWLAFHKTSDLTFRPPVHLSVLGHGGFWDLAVLDPYKLLNAKGKNQDTGALPLVCDPEAAQLSTEKQSPLTLRQKMELNIGIKQVSFPLVPNSWKIFQFLTLGISLAYLFSLWSASVLSGSEAIAHLAPAIKDSRRPLFALTAYLHFLLVAILIWASRFYVNHEFKESLLLLFLGVTMALLLLVCGFDLEERDGAQYAWGFRCAAILTIFGVIQLWRSGNLDYMFMWRSMNLTSGVSPLLPVLLLLAAGLWGAWHTLSGSVFVDQRRPALPRTKPSLPGLNRYRAILEDDQKNLIKLLRPDYFDPRISGIAILVFFAAWQVAGTKPVRSMERSGFEAFLSILIAMVSALLVATVFRLCGIWRELKRLLQSLDSTRLRRGFKTLKGFSWSPIWRIGAGSLGDFRRLLSLEYEARDSVRDLGVELGATPEMPINGDPAKPLRDIYDECVSNWLTSARELRQNEMALQKGPHDKLKHPFSGLRALPFLGWIGAWLGKIKKQRILDRHLIEEFKHAQCALAEEGSEALNFLSSNWQKFEPKGETEYSITSKLLHKFRKVMGEAAPSAAALHRSKVVAVEEFVALLYTTFILIVIVRMRSLVVAIGGMYIFVMLSLSIYPFQPQVGIRLSLIALLVFIVSAVGMVYAQMHRDATLSYITDTRPGELGGDFWVRISAFMVLPILSLIASQYPEIGGVLNSWIEPALGALK